MLAAQDVAATGSVGGHVADERGLALGSARLDLDAVVVGRVRLDERAGVGACCRG